MVKRTSLKELENWKPEEWKMPKYFEKEISREKRKEFQIYDRYHNSEPYKEGFSKGAEEKHTNILNALLEENIPREMIAKVMGLSESRVVSEQASYVEFKRRKLEEQKQQLEGQQEQLESQIKCLKLEEEYLNKLWDELVGELEEEREE